KTKSEKRDADEVESDESKIELIEADSGWSHLGFENDLRSVSSCAKSVEDNSDDTAALAFLQSRLSSRVVPYEQAVFHLRIGPEGSAPLLQRGSSRCSMKMSTPQAHSPANDLQLLNRFSTSGRTMAFYLGIDAGGTKTICAISDGREIVGRGASGTIKIKKVGTDKARIALEETLARAFDAARVTPEQISASCIGVAGAGLPEVVEWTTSNMRELVPGPLTVVGDSDIAHESAFHGGPGVLVIAGTGSIAIGKNSRGVTARAGGWGPMISDEGSGFWIGRRAVAAAMRAYDAGQSTSLITKIMEGWKI